MATLVEITSRSAYTTQALATMGIDPRWDAALGDYLRLEALDWADCEFGAFSVATEASKWSEILLSEKYGKAWRKKSEAVAEWQPASEAMSAAEDAHCEAYSEPHWEASRALMRTPAPTLAAALFKIAMIEREELDRENAPEGQCMPYVTEDMARLAA